MFCGEDVYHILMSADDNYDAIECAIRESTHHWGMGVCTLHEGVQPTEPLSKAVIDEIVADTVHIFTPALDGEGYLIWSPTQELVHDKSTEDTNTLIPNP